MGNAMNNGAVGLTPTAMTKFPPIVAGYVPANRRDIQRRGVSVMPKAPSGDPETALWI